MSSSNIFLDKLLIIKSTGLLSFESSTVCSKKSEVAGFIGYPLSWKKDIVFNSSWNFLYLTVVSFHMKEIELAIKSANCTPKLILESTIERELMGKGKDAFAYHIRQAVVSRLSLIIVQLYLNLILLAWSHLL